MNQVFHEVDNNILQNLPILIEYVGMAEDIYGPSVPHLKGKTFRQNFQYVEPIILPTVPKSIIDIYNNVTLWCDLMHINGIGFLNTIFWHILFATVSMIKNIKVKNIEDGIKQVNKLYLRHGFKITRINADRKF